MIIAKGVTQCVVEMKVSWKIYRKSALWPCRSSWGKRIIKGFTEIYRPVYRDGEAGVMRCIYIYTDGGIDDIEVGESPDLFWTASKAAAWWM